MGRTDFVENRAEVIKNIYTLYSYAINGSEEEKDWAFERFRHGAESNSKCTITKYI